MPEKRPSFGVHDLRTREEDAARKRIEREAARQEVAAITRSGTLRGSVIRQHYADFLKGYHWDYFVTATFRKARHDPYYATNAVWNELEKHSAHRGFMVAEPFQSGDLHIHGIVSGPPPGWKPEIELPWNIWDGLFKRFGRARVDLINDRESVSLYCGKYVLKQQRRVCDYYEVFGEPWEWKSGILT